MATIPEALQIAVNHHQAGQLQRAEHLYRQILEAAPQHPDAMHYLGLVWYQHGKHTPAIDSIHRAARLKPNNATVLCDLGTVYDAAEEYDQAISSYRQALQIDPNHAQTHNNLGNTLVALQQHDEAIISFQKAIELKPDYATAHYNLGRALELEAQHDEAITSYQQALQLQPAYPTALYNLAVIFHEQGKLDEAVACYQKATQVKPNYTEAFNNLGNALRAQGQFKEAIESFQQAIQIKPDHADAHHNLGISFDREGRVDEAIASYQHAVKIDPIHAEAHTNLGLTLLLKGNFERGWAEHEWRWKIKSATPRKMSKPKWNGSDLTGRTILFHHERGLGDTLQFIRYASLAKQRGARVVVECQKPLVALLRSCLGIDELVSAGDELPAHDVYLPLLSAPGIMQTRLDTVPVNVPYIFADTTLVHQWREELRKLKGFKIGICWQGNPNFKDDHRRSFPLSCFAPLTNVPSVQLISLQKGAGIEQLADVNFPITDLGTQLDEHVPAFMDTAAVMMNLDLVIACDTSIAHLAGALGVPVWGAHSLVPDWRWFLNREDSPWYPTMRLFRQKEQDNWNEVFDRMAMELNGITHE